MQNSSGDSESPWNIIIIIIIIIYCNWVVTRCRTTTEKSQDFHILYPYTQMDMPASDHSVLLDIQDFKFQINPPPCPDQRVLLVLVHSAPNNTEKRMQIRKTWGSILQGSLLFVLGEVDSPLLQVKHSRYSRYSQTCGTVSVGSSSWRCQGTVFCVSKHKMLLDEWHSITCWKTCIFQQKSVVMSIHHIYSTVSTTFLWLSLQVSLESENDQYHDILQGSFKDTYRNMTYKHIMALKWVLYYCPGVHYVLKSDDDTFVNTPVLMRALAKVVHYSIFGLLYFKTRNQGACLLPKPHAYK